MLYYLAHYQEYQDLARKEVIHYWSNTEAMAFEHLDKMDFLNACIDEAMRLAPAAYVTYRDIEQPLQLGSFRLQPKALLILSMYVTHRNPKLWDDPLQYKPERFMGKRKQSFSFHPYRAVVC